MRQINLVKILLGIAGMVNILTSCYDDKGNYDYRDIPKVEISHTSNRYAVALNAEIKIEPEIVFPDGQEHMNLSYAWILEEQLIGTERVLVWTADRYTEKSGDNLLFEIKDEDNNLVFRRAFSLEVVKPYELQGYFVLAKKNGKVLVHQIREENSETDKKAFSTLQDIYRAENKEELPADAFKLSEMYALNKGTTSKEIMRQMMFVAPQQSDVVETTSFKKAEYDLLDMFGGS